MLLSEREITIPKAKNQDGLLGYISKAAIENLEKDEMPVRFAITRTDEQFYHCELGILSDVKDSSIAPSSSVFTFKKRSHENTERFNVVLLIPTGIGAEIGGHSGDGGPVSRILAATCDNLITHPNVVNASDINELSDNALYVEGSVISRLLMGTVSLQKVRSNRIMLVIDRHPEKFLHEAAINSASAARAACGINCPLVIEMDDRVLMRSLYSSSGIAIGRIEYLEYLFDILEEHRDKYDAVALSSVIQVPYQLNIDYYRDDIGNMVNPWGGVEAMLTHAVSLLFNVPSAHSPMMPSKEILDIDVGIVDPRKSAEAVSTTNLHSILKGLHKSPKIIDNSFVPDRSELLTVNDISCLVIPDKCVGLPTLAALEQGITVIAVRENENRMQNKLEELSFAPGQLYVVDNYLEAVGVISALKAGVTPESVRRPLAYTKVLETNKDHKPKSLIKSTSENFNLEHILLDTES